MKLLIGSKNEGKVKEFEQLLVKFFPSDIQYSSLTSYPLIHDVLENGKSFLENSTIKAKKIFQQVSIATLCDDSGLVIDALHGEPGIYSARYPMRVFGRDASMQETMQYIIDRLKDIPTQQRSARFMCALAFINSKGNLFTAQGVLEGTIACELKGEHGFGYDPIFIPKGYTTTLAMLSEEEKNTISHRYHALHALFTQMPREECI